MKRIAVDSTFVQFDQVKYILHTETVDKCIEIHLKLFVDKTGKRIMICLQRLCHLFQRKFRIALWREPYQNSVHTAPKETTLNSILYPAEVFTIQSISRIPMIINK